MRIERMRLERPERIRIGGDYFLDETRKELRDETGVGFWI